MRLSRSVLLRVTPPWPHGRGRPWFPSSRGLSLSGLLRASATLDQQMLSARRNLADRLSGKDRAARCPTRKTCPASNAIRPPRGAAVNKTHQRTPLSYGGGIPLFRSFAGGKGGSLAGRLFEGTSPPPCGVLPRKSETRRTKSPLNGQNSGRPGERCSCYGEYKPV